MKTLNELDPMPFGKYKGTPMADVPANYFHWLWTEADFKSKVKVSSVAEYIERSLDALKQEYKDGIW